MIYDSSYPSNPLLEMSRFLRLGRFWIASHSPYIVFFENIETFDRTKVVKDGINDGFDAIVLKNVES